MFSFYANLYFGYISPPGVPYYGLIHTFSIHSPTWDLKETISE